MKKYIDKVISESLDTKNKVPKELGNIIISTTNILYDKEKSEKKSYHKYYKIVAGLCASIILTTSIVFAKDITNYIKTVFNLSEHGMGEQQIQSAICDHYIQYNSSEYITSNDIAYQLEYTLLNDINLIFSIDFIIDFNIDEFNDLAISGLQIKDEKGNQIYIDSEDEKIWTKNIATSMVYNKIEKSKNAFKTSVTLVSPSFPDIKTIYISFDKIVLYTIINGEAITKEIEGNYDLQLNLDSKFSTREVSDYSFEEQSNGANLNLENIRLTNTGLGITFSCLDYDYRDYQFQLLDSNKEEIYVMKNNISIIKNTNHYFAWLDVSENIKNLNDYKLKITDSNGKVSSYDIQKK